SNLSETMFPFSSVEACPETNSRFPTLVAGLNGSGEVETSGETGYSIMPGSFVARERRCQLRCFTSGASACDNLARHPFAPRAATTSAPRPTAVRNAGRERRRANETPALAH